MMATRKTASGQLPARRSVNVDVELKPNEDIKVIRSSLQDAEPLEIDDDQDAGVDPYNSTGQFCIPAIKKKPGE